MTSIGKRLTVYIVAIVMAASGVTIAASTDTAGAASKPQLAKSTITLKAGKTTTIRVKNAHKKVVWTTGSKKIVKIKKKTGKYRQKVLLKAVRKGTCYVRAKIGKRTLKCRVKVLKAKPEENKEENNIEIRPLSEDLEDLAAGINYEPSAAIIPDKFADSAAAFSVNLFRETVKAESKKNINTLVSPDSVLTALTLTENGAAGSTLKEMEKVLSGGLTDIGLSVSDYNKYLSSLHNRLEKPDRPIYTTANSIWFNKGFFDPAKEFISTNKKYLNAVAYSAPFNDRTTVTDMNNWVFNNTRNMIDKVIDNLSPMDRVVLINALAFEGKWAEQFSEGQVDPKGTFTTEQATGQTATMLNGMLSPGSYMEINGAKAFEKPYEGNTVAFVGILPPEGTTVDEFIESLDGKSFIDGWRNRPKNKKQISIQIPEFKYDYSVAMKDVLKAMGMKESFTDAADFSRMSKSRQKEVHIDEVIHKTHIELDKNGTKAAAVTAVVMKANAVHTEGIINIHLNRPFVYALVDTKKGIPLFIGAVKTIN